MNWKRVLVEAAILIVSAATLGTGTNLFRPATRKLAWIRDYLTPEPGPGRAGSSAPTPAATGSGKDLLSLAPQKDPGLVYLEISGEVAFRLQGAGAFFLDARRSSAYESGHIAGAVNIPVWEHDADDRISALTAKGMKPDEVIVVYCSGGACEDAPMLAAKLSQAGFYNVFLYKDGFPAWQNLGWPVTRGKQP